MKLSTWGRYGARASLELALRYGSGLVTVREIGDSQNISARYLEQIMIRLRVSGIVKSIRGNKGGYELTRNPDEITLGDILRAIEGPMDIVHCTEDGDCIRIEKCAMNLIWEDVKHAIEEVVDSITLHDMVLRHNNLKLQPSYEYTI